MGGQITNEQELVYYLNLSEQRRLELEQDYQESIAVQAEEEKQKQEEYLDSMEIYSVN